MNRFFFLALLITGVVLMVLGINATSAFSSDVSRFFTETPTDKAVWLLVVGAVAAITGLIGVIGNWKHA